MASNVEALLPLAAVLIPEDHISIGRLSDLLNSAYIDHIIDDSGDIYVTDGVPFPVWISIDPDAKLILMSTFFEPEAEVTIDWLTKVNQLNTSIMVSQFSYAEGCLWGRYWITFNGGLNVRHFIKMLRRFAGAFRAGVEDVTA